MTSKVTGFATPNRGLWDISVPDANTVRGLVLKNIGGAIVRLTNIGSIFV